MKKVYVSGPMSGIKAFNIPAFDLHATELREAGYEVISPAELDSAEMRQACLESPDGKHIPNGETWGELLARDVKLLADDGIEGIVVLPGWTNSRGACLETFVGRLCGVPVYRLGVQRGDLIPVPDAELEAAHARATSPIWSPPPAKHVDNDKQLKDFPPLHTSPSLIARSDEGAEARTPHPFTGGYIKTSETGGQKEVKRNVKGDLCPKALRQLGEVCGFGRNKYSRGNYLNGFEYSSAYDALHRHLEEWWDGKEQDDESGLHPLAHAAWQCLCLLAFCLRKIGKDDRL